MKDSIEANDGENKGIVEEISYFPAPSKMLGTKERQYNCHFLIGPGHKVKRIILTMIERRGHNGGYGKGEGESQNK